MTYVSNAEVGQMPVKRMETSDKLSVGQQLESVFLAQMLKISGVGKTPDSFGGGAGEDQFSSFLQEAQAREMVRAGGLGLAAYFDQALKAKTE